MSTKLCQMSALVRIPLGSIFNSSQKIDGRKDYLHVLYTYHTYTSKNSALLIIQHSLPND